MMVAMVSKTIFYKNYFPGKARQVAVWFINNINLQAWVNP